MPSETIQHPNVDGLRQELARLRKSKEFLNNTLIAVDNAIEHVGAALAGLEKVAGAPFIPETPKEDHPETDIAPSGRGAQEAYMNRIISVLTQAEEPLSAAEIARQMTTANETAQDIKRVRDTIHKVLGRRGDRFHRVKRDGKTLWELAKPHHRNGASERTSTTPLSTEPAGESLAGKTLYEAARIVLHDNGNQPMFYRDIAAEAERRGFRSYRNEPAKPDSFREMLRLKADIFQREGGGYYRLKEARTA